MITREELLATAPKGVDYVYIERREIIYNKDAYRFYAHYIDHGWWSYEVSKADSDTPWSRCYMAQQNNELSRRWASQRAPLERWIEQLGLMKEYLIERDKYLKAPEDAAVITLTPEQQEHLPQFALDFLKSKLQVKEPGMPCAEKEWGFEISQELYADLVGAYPNPCKLIPESDCQCGAVKAKSPHSTWCPAYQR